MILPLGPIIASNKPAIDGFDIVAIVSRGNMPSDSTVIATYKINAIMIPSTVAKPTSVRFLACEDSTAVPSTPVNT